jgi:hypothetical protein
MGEAEKNLADVEVAASPASPFSETKPPLADDEIYIDPVREKKILHKCDLYMTSLLTLIWIFAYLDRSNIGNAGIAGIQEDLNMSPQEFANAVLMFYVTYVPFELPGALLVKKIKPSRLLTFFMFAIR